MEIRGFRISQLAEEVGGTLFGHADRHVERISSLDDADERSIIFIDDPRSLARASESGAGCCITPPLDQQEFSMPRIEVTHPKLAFAMVGNLLHPRRTRRGGVHPTAVVAPTAQIDATAYVGPHVHVDDHAEVGPDSQLLSGAYVGERVRIGANCVIHPNVVLYDGVVVGDRVVVHAGAVIGADGFGYVRGPSGYVKFPQIGSVFIGDDVEVGANTCIDRGALGSTRVGRGTKIDNLVMIAHNVEVGERVIMAGQVGVSGSTRIGNDVVLAGQVGLADHAEIQDGVRIGAKSAVFPGKTVRAGSTVMGIPARPVDRYKRTSAQTSRLPQLRAEVDALRQKVARLTARADHERDGQS